MSERLGQPLVLENRGGAGGTIGTDLAAKARPDGYTLLVGIISPMAANVELFAGKLPYDPRKDFAPISMITKIPVLLTVHPSMPVRNMKELIALAKKSPGKLSYGSAGVGTTNNLSGELVNLEAGIKTIHVPFKGAGPAMVATIAGETDMLYSGPPGALPHVRSGRVRAIAVTSEKRMAQLPAVSTMVESGLKNVVVFGWYSLVAPAGTPQDIVDRLRHALIETMKVPNVVATLADQGATLEPSTPAELRDFIDAEIRKWSRVIKAARITIQ
jgi:tripartite-type tricarboxylate transporter receptor subunit TctC